MARTLIASGFYPRGQRQPNLRLHAEGPDIAGTLCFNSDPYQFFIACIRVEIFMVAKLENVSDTAYGKII